MKSAKDVLSEVTARPNDERSRLERLEKLDGLCDRMIEFRNVLHERGRGPSVKEMGRILDDLRRLILKIRLWDDC